MLEQGGVDGLVDGHLFEMQLGEIVVVFIDIDRIDHTRCFRQLEDDFLDHRCQGRLPGRQDDLSAGVQAGVERAPFEDGLPDDPLPEPQPPAAVRRPTGMPRPL